MREEGFLITKEVLEFPYEKEIRIRVSALGEIKNVKIITYEEEEIGLIH